MPWPATAALQSWLRGTVLGTVNTWLHLYCNPSYTAQFLAAAAVLQPWLCCISPGGICTASTVHPGGSCTAIRAAQYKSWRQLPPYSSAPGVRGTFSASSLFLSATTASARTSNSLSASPPVAPSPLPLLKLAFAPRVPSVLIITRADFSSAGHRAGHRALMAHFRGGQVQRVDRGGRGGAKGGQAGAEGGQRWAGGGAEGGQPSAGSGRRDI